MNNLLKAFMIDIHRLLKIAYFSICALFLYSLLDFYEVYVIFYLTNI